MEDIDFLLVIPVYREHVRFPPFLQELLQALHDAPFTTRVAIIDDGSPASEREALQRAISNTLSTAVPGICFAPMLQLPENTGKGNAILYAWRLLHPGHRHLAFVDADGAVPAAEVLRILTFIKGSKPECPCYAGSRETLPGIPPRNVQRHPLRHALGRIFSRLANALLHTGVTDTQCGFKILSHNAFHLIAPRLQGCGLCFDIELLSELRRTGLEIREVPIDWREVPGGSVSVQRHGFQMLKQLYCIWRRGNRT